MFENYFGNEQRDSAGLPETVQLWATRNDVFESGEIWFPPPPLVRQTASGDLQINLTYNSQTKERTLMLAEKKWLTPAALAPLGLTRRETEIVFWMAQGKTNAEIGFLCHISSGTVKKHAENIYIKLGVETRTAVMLRALEVL